MDFYRNLTQLDKPWLLFEIFLTSPLRPFSHFLQPVALRQKA
jgi:hypothetical protein